MEIGKFRLESAGKRRYIINTGFEAPKPIPLPAAGAAELSGICRMEAEPAEPVPIRSGGLTQVLNAAALTDCEIRTRRSGDEIHPLGAPGMRLLSDVLTDKKVPRAERDVLPVLARGDRILWIPGICIDETAKVLPGDKAVKIRCTMLY